MKAAHGAVLTLAQGILETLKTIWSGGNFIEYVTWVPCLQLCSACASHWFEGSRARRETVVCLVPCFILKTLEGTPFCLFKHNKK